MASTARSENIASVTSDIAAQDTLSDYELEQTVVRNVDRGIQNTVEVSGNSDVTSGTNESPISANQLHSIFDTYGSHAVRKRKTGLDFRIKIK